MNTHSPSAIEAQAAVDRISRTGQSTGPEGAYSLSLFGDRKGDFSPTVMVESGCIAVRQIPLTERVGKSRHSDSAAARSAA